MEQPIIDPQNREQQLAFDLVANTNSSFFLTGRAGTGKTTFLHAVQRLVRKQFVTLAPTGVAAILAGGDTIHSFFGLPMDICVPGICGKMSEARILTLIHADTIIIDEVSMVRCDVMDAIDCTMRHILRSNQPFGGKQMIFVGDMFQLPPVVNQKEERNFLHDLYGTSDCFFYKARAISHLRLVKIEFRKVYRQDDERFLHILENVRLNRVTPEDIMHLNQRVCPPSEVDGAYITLTSANKTADAINHDKLSQLTTPEFIYEGTTDGNYEVKRMPVELRLHLKEGAQVMFLRNDPQRRWANGTLGIVSKLAADEIHVTLHSGETYSVSCCTWESYTSEYDRKERKIKKVLTGTFTQYPLRLAWAITIHKSQGTTFDRMYLDLSHNMFANGQLYVALSRVRTLQGLHLSCNVSPQQAHTSREILAYASGYNDMRQIANEIESGKAVYQAQLHNDYDEAARQYLLLVQKRAAQGDIKEAMQQAKCLLDTLVSDDHLYDTIDSIPSQLLHADHWAPRFLVALLSLYAGLPEQALRYVDAVLSVHLCSEALYIKSRALAQLERYAEADAVNQLLAGQFDMATPDAKVLYMIAMLNELHVGDPGLDLMRRLVQIRPRYDRAILSMRMLMQRHGFQLETTADTHCELVEAFNSSMSDEELLDRLKICRKKASKAVSYLLRRIEKQEFPEGTA